MSTVTFQIVARALAVLLSLSPLSKPHEQLPGWNETPVERLHRYVSIAVDTAVVAEETCRGGAKSAGDRRACERNVIHTLLGIAWHESGFAPDVDLGPCYLGVDGKGKRCDGGDAHSMWQLRPLGCVTGPHAPRNPDGTLKRCEEAVLYDTDRKAAAREALKRIARSRRACILARVPREEQLAIYAGGGCMLSAAQRRARELHASIVKASNAPDLPTTWSAPLSPPAGTPAPVLVEPVVVAQRP